VDPQDSSLDVLILFNRESSSCPSFLFRADSFDEVDDVS
jgi:hypothetical protein